MAAKITYTVPQVPGSKRTSHRPYTHAVIGSYDPALVVAKWRAYTAQNAAKILRDNTKNWNDWSRVAALNVGDLYVNHNGYRVDAKDYEIRIAKEFIAKHPTLPEYLDHQEREFQERCTAELARGMGELEVLRWSMSHANACKGLSEFGNYAGVQVVTCEVAR